MSSVQPAVAHCARPRPTVRVQHKVLFNFAASYSTGGYKRLYEYAKWFNQNGGAWFVIHPACSALIREFPHIRCFVATQSRLQRLYDDCGYLRSIGREIGRPELYYSYGIPLYARFGQINWFHLSNVLPLGTRDIPLPLAARAKAGYLGRRIRAGMANADVISAESQSSLDKLIWLPPEKLFCSVNGSDEELEYLRGTSDEERQNIAIVVGTAAYKALDDSFRVFEGLRDARPGLRLVLVGNPEWIPRWLRHRPQVTIAGLRPRAEVIGYLRSSAVYISTTRIENSYNAASEGIFLADESYISDIGPHRELLQGERFARVHVPGVDGALLKVRRTELSGVQLKSWETVINEMIERFRRAFRVAA